MELHLLKDTDFRLPRQRLQRLFGIVVKQLKATRYTSTINVVFTSDARVKQLNRRYRGKDMRTDVLSFNIDELSEPQGVLGEIYIAVPYAQRQAAGYGGSVRDELVRLTCHGLLHLFGYDHQAPADRGAMETLQEMILDRLKGDTR